MSDATKRVRWYLNDWQLAVPAQRQRTTLVQNWAPSYTVEQPTSSHGHGRCLWDFDSKCGQYLRHVETERARQLSIKCRIFWSCCTDTYNTCLQTIQSKIVVATRVQLSCCCCYGTCSCYFLSFFFYFFFCFFLFFVFFFFSSASSPSSFYSLHSLSRFFFLLII